MIGKKIGRFRCASCTTKKKHRDGVYANSGWNRYEYNGVRYRSKWEVEAAELLDTLQIPFVYEKKDEPTNTRPDFYIPELDRYLEIHPDRYGKKPYIENCIVVKTKEHAIASVLAIGFRIRRARTIHYIKQMQTRSVQAIGKHTFSLAYYLREMIETEVKQNIS